MFVVLFGVGIGFILLSAFIDTFLDFGGISVLQPKLIAIFLTVTGGIGLILTNRFMDTLAFIFILLISISVGLLAATAIYRFIIRPLKKAENTSTFDKQDTIGTTAKVVSPIPKGGYGKIRYSVSGSVVTGPAKSEDDSDIGCGEEVFIMDIDKGTYFVRRNPSISTFLKPK